MTGSIGADRTSSYIYTSGNLSDKHTCTYQKQVEIQNIMDAILHKSIQKGQGNRLLSIHINFDKCKQIFT